MYVLLSPNPIPLILNITYLWSQWCGNPLQIWWGERHWIFFPIQWFILSCSPLDWPYKKEKNQHPICQTHFEGRHTGPWDACETLASEKHLHVEWVKTCCWSWNSWGTNDTRNIYADWSLCHCLPTCLCSVCLDPNIWGNDMTWMQVLWQSRKWTESMKFKKKSNSQCWGWRVYSQIWRKCRLFFG